MYYKVNVCTTLRLKYKKNLCLDEHSFKITHWKKAFLMAIHVHWTCGGRLHTLVVCSAAENGTNEAESFCIKAK